MNFAEVFSVAACVCILDTRVVSTPPHFIWKEVVIQENEGICIPPHFCECPSDFPASQRAKCCIDNCLSELIERTIVATQLVHGTLAKLFHHDFPKYPVWGRLLGKHSSLLATSYVRLLFLWALLRDVGRGGGSVVPLPPPPLQWPLFPQAVVERWLCLNSTHRKTCLKNKKAEQWIFSWGSMKAWRHGWDLWTGTYQIPHVVREPRERTHPPRMPHLLITLYHFHQTSGAKTPVISRPPEFRCRCRNISQSETFIPTSFSGTANILVQVWVPSLPSSVQARDCDRHSAGSQTHKHRWNTVFLYCCQNIGVPQTKHQGDTGGHVDLTDVVWEQEGTAVKNC